MKLSLMFLVSLICICLLVQAHARDKAKDPGAHDILAGTIGALESEGLLHAEQIDAAKTSIEQLASQNLNKRRSRQTYLVHVVLRDSANIEAIAVRDNSSIAEESGLIVYVVSKVLQPDGKPVPQPQ